jgi:hypothetical protein
MTTSQVLQDCPLREALRKDIWPNGVNLQYQLYQLYIMRHPG